jgi:hypothetical protein
MLLQPIRESFDDSRKLGPDILRFREVSSEIVKLPWWISRRGVDSGRGSESSRAETLNQFPFSLTKCKKVTGMMDHGLSNISFLLKEVWQNAEAVFTSIFRQTRSSQICAGSHQIDEADQVIADCTGSDLSRPVCD